jgi:hypothetical protein
MTNSTVIPDVCPSGDVSFRQSRPGFISLVALTSKGESFLRDAASDGLCLYHLGAYHLDAEDFEESFYDSLWRKGVRPIFELYV